MQKFEQNLTVNTSGALRALAGASVTITDNATGLPASLYSDNGVTPLAQPLTTDSDGYFGFYAADGKYTLTFSGPRFATFTRQILLEDPADNPYATLGQLAAPSGSTLINHGGTPLNLVLEALAESSGGQAGSVSAVNGVSPNGAGNVNLTTDNLPESGTPANLWFTAARVRSVVLTGLSLASGAAASATDNVLQAIGKLQAQFNTKDASGGFPGLTGFAVNIKNAAGTIASSLASAATSARAWTLPDKSGTVALTSDVAMVLLGTATISSPVANVDFLNLFSDTYNKYLVEVEGLTTAAAGQLALRAAVSGAVDGSSNYYGAVAGEADMGLVRSDMLLGYLSTSYVATFAIELRNMRSASGSKSVGIRGRADTSLSREGAMTHSSAISGFRIFNSGGGSLSAGTVRVYGVRAA